MNGASPWTAHFPVASVAVSTVHGGVIFSLCSLSAWPLGSKANRKKKNSVFSCAPFFFLSLSLMFTAGITEDKRLCYLLISLVLLHICYVPGIVPDTYWALSVCSKSGWDPELMFRQQLKKACLTGSGQSLGTDRRKVTFFSPVSPTQNKS